MRNPNFYTGARRTPRHILMATPAFINRGAPPPDQFAAFPPLTRLNNEGNDQFGDCVTAEECYAKVSYAARCGLNLTISRDLAIQAARRFGGLNGADLQDIMNKMATIGLVADDGQTYKDGPFTGVNWSDETVLRAALTVGPVKLGMDAGALPSGAGSQQGWYATKSGHYANEDHSTTLDGYGTAEFIYDALKLSLPSGLAGSTPGYGFYTWGTIGFVTHDWLMGCVWEAYVRNPTTIGQSPVPPTPPYVAPLFLFEGDMANLKPVGVLAGYPDLASAEADAHKLADADKTGVMVHDSAGKMVETIVPTPPAPVVVPVQFKFPQTQCVHDGVFGGYHVPEQILNGTVTLPQALQGAMNAGAIPAWLLPFLQLACAEAQTLPDGIWKTLAQLACSQLPPANKPCGKC